MTITAEELRKEIVRLEGCEPAEGHADGLARTIELHKLALLGLQSGKDAERYRWLRDRTGKTNRWPHVAQYPRQDFDQEEIIQVWDKDGYHAERLDSAIDQAISAERK